MTSYYARNAAQHIDGSPIFKTKEDEATENRVAKMIEQAWKCECRSFGKLAAIDWYFVRHERLVGVGELKTRNRNSAECSAFLNFRKWLALTLASYGLGTPAIFVVSFTDCVKWINLAEINPSNIFVGGLNQIVKSRNDIEPIIKIDTSKMNTLINKDCKQ